MKIVIYIAGFGQGGAQNQCIYLINELVKTVDLHVVYHYEGENFYKLKIDKNRLNQIDVSSFYNPINIIRVAKVINKLHPDVLFSWLQSSDFYSYFVQKMSSRKVAWVMAERDSSYPNFDIRFILRNFFGKRASAIICNSLAGLDYWKRRGVSIRDIHVISNIVKVPALLQDSLVKVYDVTYAGRLVEQKNIHLVVASFIYLAKNNPTFKFLIVGDGLLFQYVQSKIIAEGLDDRIVLKSFTTDIESYFRSTKVFVNFSIHEGTPNTVIENIMLNNIVVLSNIDGHTSLVGKNYKYLLTDLDNVVEAASVINQALLCENDEGLYDYAIDKLNSKTPEFICSEYFKVFTTLLEVDK